MLMLSMYRPLGRGALYKVRLFRQLKSIIKMLYLFRLCLNVFYITYTSIYHCDVLLAKTMKMMPEWPTGKMEVFSAQLSSNHSFTDIKL